MKFAGKIGGVAAMVLAFTVMGCAKPHVEEVVEETVIDCSNPEHAAMYKECYGH